MPAIGFRTRARAWLLRTFRGRPASTPAWEEEPSPAAAPSAAFDVGGLRVVARLAGSRATGINQPAVLYDVEVSLAPGRRWASRYGLEPRAASPAAAVEHALDELDLLWRARADWESEVTAGMSDDEAEAMLASPLMEADISAAAWVGPELDAVRAATKVATGRWTGGAGEG